MRSALPRRLSRIDGVRHHAAAAATAPRLFLFPQLLLLLPLLLPLLLLLMLPASDAFRSPVPPRQQQRRPASSTLRVWSSSSSSSPTPSTPQQAPGGTTSSAALQDVVATLERDGRFTRLVELIQAAGMEGTLQAEGPWTLLAPTDATLDDAGFNLTLSVARREPQRHLGRILAYHVIPGRRAGLTEFVNSGDNRSRVKTLERSGLSVAVYGGSILVDETRITEWGLEASNGVIHVLDGLLQPVIPGFDPFAQAQEQAEGPPTGVTPPLGFFDPLGFWEGKGQEEQARLRAAELKHGRLAMLAAAGILGQELLLRSSALAAVSSPSSLSLPFELPAWAAVGLALAPGAVYEGTELLAKGQDSTGGKGPTEFLTRILEQESPDFEAERAAKRERREMESKELNNGRLAMIAVLGMIAQEAVTGKGLF